MKIRILKGCVGIGFSYGKDTIADVDNELGQDLVSAGLAEPFKDTKPTAAKAGAKKNAES
ncbi:MAG: hypothetical protein IJT23_08960 [Clostridia bacterium]|nr:hypothetical protein [Clostridia bacterium]